MNMNKKAILKEDIEWFLTQISKVQTFSVLSDKELRQIIKEMRSFDFKAGTTIVNQGESANLFFIVQQGEVDVTVKKFFFKNRNVATLNSGDFFGESVLVSNSKRIATVTAKTDISCFILLKASFQYLMNQNPLFKKSMQAVFSKRQIQLKNA